MLCSVNSEKLVEAPVRYPKGKPPGLPVFFSVLAPFDILFSERSLKLMVLLQRAVEESNRELVKM